jgi:hypothetical protein
MFKRLLYFIKYFKEFNYLTFIKLFNISFLKSR